MNRSVLLGVLLAFATSVCAEDAVPDQNPLSGNAEAIKQGQRDYRSNCSNCHGAQGAGDGSRAPPNTANLQKFNKGFKNFIRIVKEGVQRGGVYTMPPWGGVHNNETFYRIGAFLETKAQPGAT